MPEVKCTLDPDRRNCNTVGRCTICGWEAGEIQRRKDIFEEDGLTLCGDGLERLIIGRLEVDG